MNREKNEIKIYPLKKWYLFTQKIPYETLTFEMADARMAQKKEPEWARHAEETDKGKSWSTRRCLTTTTRK
jgi:hypothetical protein